MSYRRQDVRRGPRASQGVLVWLVYHLARLAAIATTQIGSAIASMIRSATRPRPRGYSGPGEIAKEEETKSDTVILEEERGITAVASNVKHAARHAASIPKMLNDTASETISGFKREFRESFERARYGDKDDKPQD